MSAAECFCRIKMHINSDFSCFVNIFIKKTELIFFHGCIHLTKSKFDSYTKRPESKYDDDEIDGVSEEHQHIHVCHCAVLWMDQVIEELPHGKIYLHEPIKSKLI